MSERPVVGIFGGSFNPPHRGHLNVAVNVLDAGVADAVVMMVSPANPFKDGQRMADAGQRVEMTRLMVGELAPDRRIWVSDLELAMPVPTYTIRTMRRLRELHPDCRFKLIIGADNVESFGKWRESEAIAREFGLLVYPRPGYSADKMPPGSVILSEVAENGVSSTLIRQWAAEGEAGLRRIAGETGRKVADYIRANSLFGFSVK